MSEIQGWGTDPTAKEAGKNKSARIYVGTEKKVLSGMDLSPLDEKRHPLTAEQDRADLQGANQIGSGFDADNQKLADCFKQSEIHDFRFFVEPPPYSYGDDGMGGKFVSGSPGASHPSP